jgi:hypothetical protein
MGGTARTERRSGEEADEARSTVSSAMNTDALASTQVQSASSWHVSRESAGRFVR